MVLQDFNAGHSSELSIQVGQTVELLERPSERPGWCLVRTTERSPPQEGLVPSSALCISHSRSSVEMDCFFPLVKGREKGGGGMRTRGRWRCGPLVRRASWHSLVSGACFDLCDFSQRRECIVQGVHWEHLLRCRRRPRASISGPEGLQWGLRTCIPKSSQEMKMLPVQHNNHVTLGKSHLIFLNHFILKMKADLDDP